MFTSVELADCAPNHMRAEYVDRNQIIGVIRCFPFSDIQALSELFGITLILSDLDKVASALLFWP